MFQKPFDGKRLLKHCKQLYIHYKRVHDYANVLIGIDHTK